MQPDMDLPTSSIGSTTFTQRSRWRFFAMVGVVVVAVVLLGALALQVVRREVRHLVEANLTTAVNAAANAADTWMERRARAAGTLALRKLVADQVAVLADDAGAAERIRHLTEPFIAQLGVQWWAVVDPSGRILVAADPALTGKQLPADAAAGLDSAMKGVPLTVPPMVLPELGDPLFLSCARIPGGTPAILVIGNSVRSDFGSLFANHPGETGEIYVFDGKGRMLTESRFTASLRGTLLPADGTTTIFAVELRDASGAAPGALRSTLPFTRPVREALANRDGTDLDGYVDYRGHLALVAWKWLPKHGLGIAVKMDSDEAYRALVHLTWLFVALLALICAGGMAVAAFMLVNARLSRRARHAERTAQALGQYQLERKLGEGGMGAVYLATHRMLRRKTAVKMITGRVDAETVARFEREVRLCCQLSHPNTIAIYDFGHTAEGVFYYAMECLDGMDLQALVERDGPMPPGRVIHLLTQACGSLAEAHRGRLLHRDIKPANIFITERGGIADFVKVLDFGLVKKLGGNTGSTLSRADIISGTPGYMAPEVIGQRPDVDGRADLYALALVGFFMLTGREAFTSAAVMDLLMAHLNQPPPAPSRFAAVPADLEAVILGCLAKEPKDRPADAEAMAAALQACADARSWSAADARAWWRDHPLSAKPAVPDSSLAATVLIAR